MPLNLSTPASLKGLGKAPQGAAEGPSLAPGGAWSRPSTQLDLPQRSGRAAAPGTAKIGAGSAFGFLAQPPGRRTAMAQLAATQPVTALRPHTPPPIAAPVNIRPGEKTRKRLRVLERRLVVGDALVAAHQRPAARRRRRRRGGGSRVAAGFLV